MAINRIHLHEVEGNWDELIQHPDQFAGQRVRVTVISGSATGAASLKDQISQWLAKGQTLKINRPERIKADAFADALVEKYRKQGLVL